MDTMTPVLEPRAGGRIDTDQLAAGRRTDAPGRIGQADP